MILDTLTTVFNADLSGLNSAFSFANKSIKGFSSTVSGVGKGLAAAGAGITASVTVPLGFLGKSAIAAASDAEETAGKFGVVFRDIAGEANAMASSLSQDFDFAGVTAQKLLSDTGDLLAGFGFGQEEALKMSDAVARLGGDLASFTNYSGGAEGASKVIAKALLGERESLKGLGVAITEADIKRLAEDQGIVGELNRQQKAMLTMQLITKQSANAIGDYARTSGSLANVTRALGQEFLDLKVEIGKMLIETLHLPEVLKSAGGYIKKITEFFKKLSPEGKKFTVITGLIVGAIGPLVAILGGLLIAAAPVITVIGIIGVKVALIAAAVVGAVAAIGLFIGSLFTLSQEGDTIGEKFSNSFSTIVDWIKTAGQWFVNLGKTIVGFFMNFSSNAKVIVDWFKGNWRSLLMDAAQLFSVFTTNMIINLGVAGQKMVAIFGAILGYIMDDWDTVLIDIVNRVVQFAKDVIGIGFDLGKNFIKGIKNALTGGPEIDAAGIFDTFIQGAAQRGTLGERIQGALEVTPDFRGLTEGFQSTVEPIEGLRTDFEIFTDAVKENTAATKGNTTATEAKTNQPAATEEAASGKLSGVAVAGSVEAYQIEAQARLQQKAKPVEKSTEANTKETADATKRIASKGVKIDGTPTVKVEGLAVANF